MKNNRFQIVLSYLIVFLFIGSTIIPTISSEDGDILYVDDDNKNGPWDGSQQHPFQFIQEAVTAAKTGDEIFVYNGFYQENIIVEVSVSIIGEQKNTTIVDGDCKDNVFNITVDNVKISEFTIQNSGTTNDHKIYSSDRRGGIKITANNTIISNNIIKNNNGYGIVQDRLKSPDPTSYGTVISNNIIEENDNSGIYVLLAHGVTITNNNINNNFIGINFGGLFEVPLTSWNITENWIINNKDRGIFFFFLIINSNISNNIIKNHNSAIWFAGGGNDISKNHIELSKEGIFITKIWNQGINHIHHNNFINCFQKGDFVFNILSEWLKGSLDRWDKNYWGHSRTYPKCIRGTFYFVGQGIRLPCFLFDLNPASEPYDVDDTTY